MPVDKDTRVTFDEEEQEADEAVEPSNNNTLVEAGIALMNDDGHQ